MVLDIQVYAADMKNHYEGSVERVCHSYTDFTSWCHHSVLEILPPSPPLVTVCALKNTNSQEKPVIPILLYKVTFGSIHHIL